MSTPAVPLKPVTAKQLSDDIRERIPKPEEATLEEISKVEQELSTRYARRIRIEIHLRCCPPEVIIVVPF
jgi:hypothetical protein